MDYFRYNNNQVCMLLLYILHTSLVKTRISTNHFPSMDTQTNIHRCLPKIAELGKIGQVYVRSLTTVCDVYPRQN